MAIEQEQKDEIGTLLLRLSQVLTLEEAKAAFMSGENLVSFDVPCVGFMEGKLVSGVTTFELNEERLAALAGMLRMARAPVGSVDLKSIYDLGLKKSVADALSLNHISKVGDLRSCTVRQLLGLNKMTKVGVDAIVVKLEELGISLTY